MIVELQHEILAVDSISQQCAVWAIVHKHLMSHSVASLFIVVYVCGFSMRYYDMSAAQTAVSVTAL